MTLKEFDLSEYATLAEQKAKQKQLDAETKARMDAEASRLERALADALFDPYVGKIVAVGNGRYRLYRGRITAYGSKTPGLVLVNARLADELAFTGTDAQWEALWRRGGYRDEYGPHGWRVQVEWKGERDGMLCTLIREGRDHHSTKRWPDETIPGHHGDVGTQAKARAASLAEEIGNLLVLEAPKKTSRG